MRILVFTTAYDPLIGGAELALSETVKRLPHHSFDILTARHSKNFPAFENRGHIKIYRLGFGLKFLDKHLFMFLAPLKARQLHAQKKYNFAWAMMANQAGVAAFFVKKITRLPYLLTLQEGDSEKWVRIRDRLSFGIYKKIYRQAAVIQTISNFLSQRARNFGAPAPIFRIPNGLDSSLFEPADSVEKSVLREKLGLPKDKFIVVTTSRLVEKNGVGDLVKAVAKIPNIFLLIVGDGPLRGSLEKLAQEIGIGTRVKFTGEIPYSELPGYLRAADIFARPSLSEGLGSAFLEAQACGLPVVATEVGGIPDIVRDGFNGLFCKVNDPDDLASKIKILIDDKRLYENLRVNAINFVSDFDWSKIAYQMEKVFESAAKPKQRILIATGIFPPDIGGPSSYVAKLGPALLERGFGVGVVTYADGELKNQESKIKDINESPKMLDYVIYRVWRTRNKVLQYAKYFWQVFKLLPYYDLVYLQDLVSAGLPTMLACKLRRKKYILKIVGDYAWERSQVNAVNVVSLDNFNPSNYSWKIRLMDQIQKSVARHAERVITPSNYLKNMVAAWIGRKPVVVVYNAVEVLNNLSKADLRKELDLKGVMVLSVGRLLPLKGFDQLIRLVPELMKDIGDFKLLIFGGGPDRERLQDLIDDLGVADNVKLMGAVGQDLIHKYMAAADLVILNSAHEGLPHVLVEAMVLGTPVAASNVGGTSEVVIHGKTGILFERDNEKEIKSAILEIINNRALRERLVAGSLEQVNSKFSFNKMIDQTVEILSSI